MALRCHFNVHVSKTSMVYIQTKLHLSQTMHQDSNFPLYTKVHICHGLTHQNYNFLLFFLSVMLVFYVHNHCASLETSSQIQYMLIR